MMRRIISLGVALLLSLTIVADSSASAYLDDWLLVDSDDMANYVDNTPGDRAGAPGMEAFQKTNSYTDGQFQDVKSGTWYTNSVKAVSEYGIMVGQTSTQFGVDKEITVAEAIAIAARIRSTYFGETIETSGGGAWYKPYVDYALQHDILRVEYDDYNVPCSRSEFALFINATVPKSVTPEINSIEEGALWDVSSGSPYYDAFTALRFAGILDGIESDAYYHFHENSKYYGNEKLFESSTAYKSIYRLYRAGILSGNDEYGTFTPKSSITRSSVAAIVARVIDPSLRKTFKLETKPQTIVSFDKLGNKAALRKKATNAELEQAYNAIADIAKALSNCTPEAKTCGVAVGLFLRYFDRSNYSMKAEHYNDPYGFIILGTFSCAGTARSACLALEMLGLKYEHVGADAYEHQWARVNINGVYWVCDAYGVACPEPREYGHPLK